MKATGIFFLLVLLFVCVCLFDDCGKKSPVESKKPDLRYTDCPISPGGGTYPVGPDLVITVPEGAVQSDMTIQIAKLDQERMQEAFADFGIADFPAVAGFDVKPAGTVFSKQVTLVFKSAPQDEPYVPLTHTVDLATGVHSVDSCVTVVDNVSDSISVSVIRSGGYVVEALTDWPNLAKTTGCREEKIQVTSSDRDAMCGVQNCQSLESDVKVQFLSCDGQPIQRAVERENSVGCYATLSLTPAQSAISMNSGTTVSALLKVGCVGVKDQTIALNVSGPGSLVLSGIITDANGRGSFALMAGDSPGTIVVTGTVDVRYAVREMIIDGSVENAYYRVEQGVTAQANVLVKDLPTWHVNLEINFDGGTTAIGESGTWIGNWSTVVQYSTHLEFDLKRDTTKPGMHVFEIPGTQNISIRQGDCPLVTLRSVEYAPSSTTFEIADTVAYNHIAFQFGSLSYQPMIYGIPCPSFASDVINACIWEDDDGNTVCQDVEQYIVLFCPLWESNTTTTDTISQFLDLLNNVYFVFPMDQNTYTVSGPLWFLGLADVGLDGEINLDDGLLSILSWGVSESNTSYTLTVTKKESVAKHAGDAEQAASSDTAKSKAWQNQLKRSLQMAKKFNPRELKKLKEKGLPLPVKP